MKKFIREYEGRLIEDCTAYNSKEFISMASDFKKAIKLKRDFPYAKLIGFKSVLKMMRNLRQSSLETLKI